MTLLRQGTVNKQRQDDRTLDQSFSLVGEHSPTADRAVSAEQFRARLWPNKVAPFFYS
jgi:hypothetical protein